MSRIVSFDQFKTKAGKMADKSNKPKTARNEAHEYEHEEHEEGHEHYMFFQNLISIKHYIEEILSMDPSQIDDLLKNGHDWACDHIATSKDDIQEVAEWARNEMEQAGQGSHEEEPENVVVDIEGDDDDVEVEDGEGKDEEEEEDDEEGEDEEEEEEEEQYNEDDEYNLGEGFDDEGNEE